MKKITFDKNKHKVAIIAPASGIKDGKEKLLPQTIELLEKEGFKCIYDDNILSGDKLPFFAASKEQRVKELNNALQNLEVNIILAFRGGYGSGEIGLECIDVKPVGDKILIGFSDISALHPLFNQVNKMPSIHGSVSTTILGYQNPMLKYIISVLSGDQMKLEDLQPVNNKAKENLHIKGKIVGGNLAVISTMVGSKLQLDTQDKLVFLEDTGEKGYTVHRFLSQMKNAGMFSKIKALIFSDFVNCQDDYIPLTLKTFAENDLGNIPVFSVSGIGHGERNYPIVLDGDAEIMGNVLSVDSPFELIN